MAGLRCCAQLQRQSRRLRTCRYLFRRQKGMQKGGPAPAACIALGAATKARAERALCAQCAVLDTNAIHCPLNNTDTARCALVSSRSAAGVRPASCTARLLAALPANMLFALRSQAHALGPGAAALRRSHCTRVASGQRAGAAPRSLAAATATEHPARATSLALALSLLCPARSRAVSFCAQRMCAAATQVHIHGIVRKARSVHRCSAA